MRITEIKRDFRHKDDFTDQEIREDLEWQKWTFLINTFHVLQLQGVISAEMFEEAVDCLMFFKPRCN